jgi:hypothetical protein
MSRHLVLTHAVAAEDVGESSSIARIRLGGDAIEELSVEEWLVPDRAVRLTNEQGDGWIFIVYDQPGSITTLTRTQAALVAQRSVNEPQTQQSISLLAVPTTAISQAELDMYLEPASAVTVTYTLLDHLGDPVRAPVNVEWDQKLGAYRADIHNLASAGLDGTRDFDERPELHNWYGRHRFTVDTHERGPLALPLAMFADTGASLYVTGGAASLRDESGQPLGVPVQISKNWHDPGNNFYHFYTQPVMQGLEPQTMELTIASSRWGEQAYVASHAQLSLIGYNSAGGHWDESALGCFGENITYDPDVTLGRAMVDDVRPFLVQSQNRWSWTGNVGGADFLRYTTRLSRVKSTYHAYGPNLTDVVYSGVSNDGRIQADITVQLGRTDDLVRTYYHFDYRFLEDVPYSRFALFQMAADRYGDNGFTRYAWGNAQGVVSDNPVPDHRTTGYASDADRGIALEGQAPWVMLYDNQLLGERLPEEFANLAYVVRHFEANIGETVITTPHLSIHRTFNGRSQIGFELGLPHEEGSPWCGDPCQGQTRFIPAGSRVRATVEYLVIPADKSRYYGSSDYLTAMPAEHYQSTQMALALAVGNVIDVTAHTGEVRRTYPIEIDAVPGALATEFSVTGGLGYTPVTIRGVVRHDGWQLQRQDGDTWLPVDQSVIGADYWQARYDSHTAGYNLTYNLHNRGTQRYRLLWISP